MSLHSGCRWSWFSTDSFFFSFIKCELLWFWGKIIEGFPIAFSWIQNCCVPRRLAILPKSTEPVYHVVLTYIWKEKWISAFPNAISVKCMQQTRPELELGSPILLYVPITVTILAQIWKSKILSLGLQSREVNLHCLALNGTLNCKIECHNRINIYVEVPKILPRCSVPISDICRSGGESFSNQLYLFSLFFFFF